jgi:hypothetical protein
MLLTVQSFDKGNKMQSSSLGPSLPNVRLSIGGALGLDERHAGKIYKCKGCHPILMGIDTICVHSCTSFGLTYTTTALIFY